MKAPSAETSISKEARTNAPRMEPDADRRPSTRRRFSAEYKLHILRAAQISKTTRGLGALLREEKLCASHLAKWRKQAEAGALASLASRKRGPAPSRAEQVARKLREQEREIAKWKRRAERAEALNALHGVMNAARAKPQRTRNGLEKVRRAAPEVGITAACAALGIARATYYRRLALQKRGAAARASG